MDSPPLADAPRARSAPGAWAVVSVSVSSLAASSYAIGALAVLAPLIRPDLGLSRAEVGLMTSLVFCGAAATARLGGRLTDSRGPAVVLGFSMATGGAAFLLTAVAPTALLFLGAVLLVGLANGGITPPTNAVVAGQLARRRGFFLSVKQSGVPVGGVLAGVSMPSLALALGWRWSLVVPAAVCMAVASSAVLLRGAATLGGGEETSAGPALPRSQLLTLGLFGFVMSGTQWTFLAYLTLYLTGSHSFGLSLAGIAAGLAQAFGVVGRLTWGWLSDTPGRRLRILLTTSAVSTVSLALLATGVGGALLWPLVALCGFAIVGWNGAFHALLADQAGPGRVGQASGNVLVFTFSGTFALPPLLGLVADSTGSWTALWALAAGLVTLAGFGLRAGLKAVDVRAPAALDST